MRPDNTTDSPDLSGLSAADLVTLVAGLQQQLASQEAALAQQDAALAEQETQLQSQSSTIAKRDNYIELLEELLRLKQISEVRRQQ